jgi:hypothetical protein
MLMRFEHFNSADLEIGDTVGNLRYEFLPLENLWRTGADSHHWSTDRIRV